MSNINTVRVFTITDARASFNPFGTKNGKARLTVGVKENGKDYRLAVYGAAAEKLRDQLEAADQIFHGKLAVMNPTEAVTKDGSTTFINTALNVGFKAEAAPAIQAVAEAK